MILDKELARREGVFGGGKGLFTTAAVGYYGIRHVVDLVSGTSDKGCTGLVEWAIGY